MATTPWAAVLADPSETLAFFSLLDEYFSADRGANSAPPAPARTPTARITPPAGLTTSAPTPRPPPAAASLPSFSASTFIADRALQNTAGTSAALRNAGLSAGAANSLSKFGATHHEKLAPHVAAGAKAGWATRNALGGAGAEEAQGAPPKGPKPPGGLTSSKSMAGGFDTSSGKNFGKTLFASKGPLSNEERKKNAFAEPLATRAPVSTSAGTTHKPPPMRGAQVKAQEGLGSATALYDYEGTDPSDLPCLEGEALTVTEHVSEDWWKCRNESGAEGIIPTSYLQAS